METKNETEVLVDATIEFEKLLDDYCNRKDDKYADILLALHSLFHEVVEMNSEKLLGEFVADIKYLMYMYHEKYLKSLESKPYVDEEEFILLEEPKMKQ